jgi:chloride channel 3/4/5
MPKSARSYNSIASGSHHGEAGDDFPGPGHHLPEHSRESQPPSPVSFFRARPSRTWDQSYHAIGPDETSSLLEHTDGAMSMSYRSIAPTPRVPRQMSWTGGTRFARNHSRKGSFSQKLVNALGAQRRETGLGRSSASFTMERPTFYEV